MNILVTIPVGKIKDSFIPIDVQNELSQIGNIEYNPSDKHFTKAELREKLIGKDVVITGWGTEKLDKEVLAGNTTLKIIAHTGGTVNGVVDDYAYDNGIKVLSANDIYAESVAEAVVAYILCALRRIPDYCSITKNNGWFNGTDLWEGMLDQAIGLVSFGMITKHLVKMLQPFRLKIKVYSSHISDEILEKYNMERASLEEIFSECKIISIHSALNEKTHHMINKSLLSLIPDGALFVNTARGAVVDEQALIEELGKKRFRAILDVYEQEPLPKDHALRKLDNVYAVPHMGGPTYDRRKYATKGLIKDILNYYDNKPLQLEITKKYAGFMTK